MDIVTYALLKNNKLTQANSFGDFPVEGVSGALYLAKDTGQTYYWDKISKTYIKTGTAGRTGVYSYNKGLPSVVGTSIVVKKSELNEILKPTVDFSEGSEVIGDNAIHGIITNVNGDNVTITTVTDLTIDSFRQVATLNDLPTSGVDNILYYVQDIDEFRIWDSTNGKWVEPFHPVIFNNVPAIADARLNTLYIDGDIIKYTPDNVTWVEISGGAAMKEYLSDVDLITTIPGKTTVNITDISVSNINDIELEQLVYDNKGTVGRITKIDPTTKDIEVETITIAGSGGSGDAFLTEDITSNVLVGAAPANTLFKKDTTFTEFAKKILLKEIAPTITFNATNSGLKEVGTSVSGSTLTTNITSLGTGTITSIEFYEGSNLLDTQSYVTGTNSYSFNYTNTITTNTTFKTIVYYTKADGTNSTINQTKSITFVYASYYGAVSTLTPVEADIKLLNKSIKNTKAFTWNNISVTDERFCYAYPKSFGALTSIKDANNFEYIGSYTMSTIQIDSIDYYLYVLTDPTTGSGFKQIYS